MITGSGSLMCESIAQTGPVRDYCLRHPFFIVAPGCRCYRNWKLALWLVPSLSFSTRVRQEPAHDLFVFHTYWY